MTAFSTVNFVLASYMCLYFMLLFLFLFLFVFVFVFVFLLLFLFVFSISSCVSLFEVDAACMHSSEVVAEVRRRVG